MARNPEDRYATDDQLLVILAQARTLLAEGDMTPADRRLAAEVATEARSRGLI